MTPRRGRLPNGSDWADGLGDYRRLPEWIGRFERDIAADGWPAVVDRWVPRFLPGLAVKLFHGAIRTAHASRAVGADDTEARRSELARSLGYWAARYQSGQPPDPARDRPGDGDGDGPP